MGIPSVKIIKRDLEWLDKLHTDPDRAATAVRQAMEFAEGYGVQRTLDQWLHDHGVRADPVDIPFVAAFKWMDSILETEGVEYIPSKQDGYYRRRGFEYLNVGDPNVGTVGYDHAKGRWMITTVSDVTERNPDRFADESSWGFPNPASPIGRRVKSTWGKTGTIVEVKPMPGAMTDVLVERDNGKRVWHGISGLRPIDDLGPLPSREELYQFAQNPCGDRSNPCCCGQSNPGTYEVELSYGDLNVFQRYWWGQNDPLYAILSRRGVSVDWVTIPDASSEEIERLVDTAREAVESGAGRERAVGQSFLDRELPKLSRQGYNDML